MTLQPFQDESKMKPDKPFKFEYSLDAFEKAGKILNWSQGVKNVRIYDLNGNLSNRLGTNYTFQVIYLNEAKKRDYIELDGITEKQAYEQAVGFINGL